MRISPGALFTFNVPAAAIAALALAPCMAGAQITPIPIPPLPGTGPSSPVIAGIIERLGRLRLSVDDESNIPSRSAGVAICGAVVRADIGSVKVLSLPGQQVSAQGDAATDDSSRRASLARDVPMVVAQLGVAGEMVVQRQELDRVAGSVREAVRHASEMIDTAKAMEARGDTGSLYQLASVPFHLTTEQSRADDPLSRLSASLSGRDSDSIRPWSGGRLWTFQESWLAVSGDSLDGTLQELGRVLESYRFREAAPAPLSSSVPCNRRGSAGVAHGSAVARVGKLLDQASRENSQSVLEGVLADLVAMRAVVDTALRRTADYEHDVAAARGSALTVTDALEREEQKLDQRHADLQKQRAALTDSAAELGQLRARLDTMAARAAKLDAAAMAMEAHADTLEQRANEALASAAGTGARLDSLRALLADTLVLCDGARIAVSRCRDQAVLTARFREDRAREAAVMAVIEERQRLYATADSLFTVAEREGAVAATDRRLADSAARQWHVAVADYSERQGREAEATEALLADEAHLRATRAEHDAEAGALSTALATLDALTH